MPTVRKDPQEYYEAKDIDSKLPTLTLLMIRKTTSQSPKLRAKAAEAREPTFSSNQYIIVAHEGLGWDPLLNMFHNLGDDCWEGG